MELSIGQYHLTLARKAAQLSHISDSRHLSWWWPLVREASPGAWQRNEEIRLDCALQNATIYACVTRICMDLAKMRARLMASTDGLWQETTNPAYSPVLRMPNHYQDWFQFAQWWTMSKLTHGNTYALKRRDRRGVVDGLYILDPTRVCVLQASDGSYFYELSPDTHELGLPEQTDTIIVPAREMAHDVMCPLFHPMMGVSPLFAAGWPALLAKHILNNAQKLFQNSSNPGGVLTAPKFISDDTARRLKEQMETQFTGDNFGKVLVAGDGLEYTPLGMSSAVDSQLIELLKWTDEQIAKVFGMPLFLVGGPLPPYSSVEAVTQIYYTFCLQPHATSMESVLTRALELDGINLKVALDLADLNKMDSATTMDNATKGVNGSVLTPNEARRKFDLLPLKGGDTVYMQVQDHSIAVLAERDAQGASALLPAPAAAAEPEPAADEDGTDEKSIDVLRGKLMSLTIKALARAA